ncbi:MAG: site-2 protease family protein [Chloroflexi bacterium]|nr:site-2 protease family protein [Chloroflexota bacterium]
MSNTVDDLPRAVAAAAADVMSIDDVTEAVPPWNAIRLRGRLLLPSAEAHGLLVERFRPLGRTPLLRKEKGGDREEVLALPMTFNRPRQRVDVALALFGVTALSCLFTGAQMWDWVQQSGRINWNLLDGIPFAASLLVILLAHEFGHYLTARRLGAPTSLPYFIPLPLLGLFGTMGAFIRMAIPPRNRRHLLAIGAAGPIAGLILAVPILLIGLSLSHVQPLPAGGYQMEGNSLLYAALKFLVFGKFLPSGGEDVFIHPIAFAGWAGLLVTGLNLMPAGQTDGGHIVYALLGAKGARIVTWVALAALAGLVLFVARDLWLWLILLLVFSQFQDQPLDEITELTEPQRALAAAMLIVFLLVFTPAPLTIVP